MAFPITKTIQHWKNDFKRLGISEAEGMKCKLCLKWDKKISSCKNYSEAFVNGLKKLPKISCVRVRKNFAT